uniref:SHSP domain-containing protein n=1 Tax=Syphacia muris TaxID=451379 RepID=A0A0N5AG80_9BILA
MALRKKLSAVSLNVSQFRPDELSVNVRGNTLIVEGHHAERSEDDMSKVERHFIRKYDLPEYIKDSDVQPQLQEDGTLKITFSKEEPEEDSKNIPIQVDPNWKPSASKALVLRTPIPLWWF